MAIVAIIAMGIIIYNLYNDKTDEIKKSNELQAQVNSLNETINNLQGKLDIISETLNKNSSEEKTISKDTITTSSTSKNENKQEEKTTTQNTNSTKKWDGDITTIDMSKLKKDGIQYTELKSLANSIDFVRFKNIDGTISISLNSDKITWQFTQDELEKLGFTQKYSDGFSNYIELKNISNIKFVDCGTFGQEFWKESKVLFLTNDGIVKYDSFDNVVNNKISLKSVDKLKNIVELFACNVSVTNEGGHMTVIAVDENGIAYDLEDYVF